MCSRSRKYSNTDPTWLRPQVQAAISSKPSAEGGEMKLEDLEKHLDLLKQMFIEKQKMMEGLDGAQPAAAAPAPAPAPAPAAAT